MPKQQHNATPNITTATVINKIVVSDTVIVSIPAESVLPLFLFASPIFVLVDVVVVDVTAEVSTRPRGGTTKVASVTNPAGDNVVGSNVGFNVGLIDGFNVG